MLERASAAAWSVWAKSAGYGLGQRSADPSAWLPLPQHLADTSAVAGLVWDDFLSPHVRHRLAVACGSDAAARSTVLFLAGVHDIGKSSPAFGSQDRGLAMHAHEAGLRIPGGLFAAERGTRVRHEVVGYVDLQAWLQRNTALSSVDARRYSMIVGAHHGTPPTMSRVEEAQKQSEHFGEAATWGAVRSEILDSVASETGFDRLAEQGLPILDIATQAVLSAIIIMADWIASNTEYFPLERGDAAQRARTAWRRLNLPRPWTPSLAPLDPHEHLRSRFGLPGAAMARDVQSVACAQARAMARPGLLVIESEMGSGKTEAALLAAEILAQRFDMGGVFVGLPTQATSNAMFDRTQRWLEHLPGEDGSRQHTVFLAHGKRELHAGFTDAPLYDWAPGLDPEDKDARVVVHQWLSDRKRGLLSPFVIGTIDQALMAALKTKHVMLRHLAMAGKVVILDEVHAVDAYSSVYLEGALSWFAAMDVPVILLSATLPGKQRAALVAAYEAGCGGSGGEPSNLPPSEAYPVLTVTTGPGESGWATAEPSGAPKELTIGGIADGDAATVSRLRQDLAQGGRAAVLRNTVSRAQQSYRILKEAFPEANVILAHSRFLAVDRAARDQDLLERFGKGAPVDSRPQILVATQVAEQSLDIDVDVMVSDLAPIDLLLQRAGRMHRHRERDAARPAPLKRAQLWVSGVDWGQVPPQPNRAFARIYDEYLQLRTLGVLGIEPGRNRTVTIPTDIPVLVSAVYEGEVAMPQGWQEVENSARKASAAQSRERRRAAAAFRLGAPRRGRALDGWISAGLADPESPGKAAAASGVRDGADSVEVLMLQGNGQGGLQLPLWHPSHPGEPLPAFEAPSRELARAIRGCSIAVGQHQLGSWGLSIDQFIELVEASMSVVAWEDSPQLRGELLMVVDAEGNGTLDGRKWRYTVEEGMEVMAHGG